MAIKLSVAARNARLDAIETTVGVSAVLKIFTGVAPTNCAAPDSGTVLATINCPADWASNAAGGNKDLNGTWEDTAADADGTAGHFRLYASNGTTCHIQGTAGDVGTEDLVLDNATIATGQAVSITQFRLTDGNA